MYIFQEGEAGDNAQKLLCYDLHLYIMNIEFVQLRNFRNYEELSFSPSPGINVIYGKNGSGKTNIIEAIHYLSLGKSHRTNSDRDVVRNNESFAFCSATVRKANTKIEISLNLSPNEKKVKNFSIANKRINRFHELIGQLQCVIFSPEDLLVIKEGPQLRRKLIDMMISQISTEYFIALQEYNSALNQRNAILREYKKTNVYDPNMIDIFDEQLAKYGTVIITHRARFIDELNRIASYYYEQISHNEHEKLSIQYASSLKIDSEISRAYKKLLLSNLQNDLFRGTTEKGIHREDLDILLNTKEIKVFGSQGQVRTAALCIKLAQVELFKKHSGEWPVLLLDDVMSELDVERRRKMMELTGKVQTFITCADESDVDIQLADRKYYIYQENANGKMKKFVEECNSNISNNELIFE